MLAALQLATLRTGQAHLLVGEPRPASYASWSAIRGGDQPFFEQKGGWVWADTCSL
jgi:hypothetical protein